MAQVDPHGKQRRQRANHHQVVLDEGFAADTVHLLHNPARTKEGQGERRKKHGPDAGAVDAVGHGVAAVERSYEVGSRERTDVAVERLWLGVVKLCQNVGLEVGRK